MTTVNAIGGNVTAEASQSTAGLLDRLVDRVSHVVDELFGAPRVEAGHDQPVEAYLFLNPSCCGGVIDSDLWDLLTGQRPRPKIEESSDV